MDSLLIQNENDLIFTEVQASHNKKKYHAILSSSGIRIDFPTFYRVYAYKDFAKISVSDTRYNFKLNSSLTFYIYKDTLLKRGDLEEANQLIPLGRTKKLPAPNFETMEFLQQFDKYLPAKENNISLPIVFEFEYTKDIMKRIARKRLLMSGFPSMIAPLCLMIDKALNSTDKVLSLIAVGVFICLIASIYFFTSKRFKHKNTQIVVDDCTLSVAHDDEKPKLYSVKKVKMAIRSDFSFIIIAPSNEYQIDNWIFLPIKKLSDEQLTYYLTLFK